MKRDIYFCKSWFRAKKRPTNVCSPEQAKLAHESKQPYTVLIDSIERPYCFLEIAEKVVSVGFLDEFLRESLSYVFQEVSEQQLFLVRATYREYENNTDTVLSGTTYIFKQNGTILINREFLNPHRRESATSSADVTANYSLTPKFGEYDDLVRIERI